MVKNMELLKRKIDKYKESNFNKDEIEKISEKLNDFLYLPLYFKLNYIDKNIIH